MAQQKLTVQQKADMYDKQKARIDRFDNANEALKKLRDLTKNITHSTINTFSKDDLRTYLEAIGTNEKNLRNLSRYLYYRSHIYFRLCHFYSTMFDFRCRKVIPSYSVTGNNNDKTILKGYSDSLDILDAINLQGNAQELLERCFVEDVVYSIHFMDDTGSFFYILDPDYCVISGRYMTGNYSFAVDMSKYTSVAKQQELEWLGEPLTSMYQEYQRTKVKYQEVPEPYGACFKFRTDDWQTVVPPFVSLFNSIINLADLENYQAIADEQQIYKLIYMKLKTLSGTKESDDFEISPDLAVNYFNKMLNEALPDYVAGAIVPGSDDLGVVGFNDSADTDTNRVENAQTTILNTSGGGMILNTSKITTQAGFEAALKAETEFGVSSLLPQFDGFCNMVLRNKLGSKAAKVNHFEVSVYTKKMLADDLLKSCQYSYANRLAYNTCLGFSEKDTMATLYLENQILHLPDLMKFPLDSSFTSSGSEDGYTTEVGQGAPTKDAGDLSDSGSRSRDE